MEPTVAAICFEVVWNAIWLMLMVSFIEAAVRRAMADAGFGYRAMAAENVQLQRQLLDARRGIAECHASAEGDQQLQQQLRTIIDRMTECDDDE
jgi:hypothetical protein